jgi:hypothetical protein
MLKKSLYNLQLENFGSVREYVNQIRFINSQYSNVFGKKISDMDNNLFSEKAFKIIQHRH